VATKLQFLVDDLLWIITDSQMKAAVVFAKHLKDNIDKANEQSKRNVAQKLQVTILSSDCLACFISYKLCLILNISELKFVAYMHF